MNEPDHNPVDLAINTALVRQILTGFIRSELERVGFNKAVVGLSGGLDSALVCFLAAEALGAQNVMAVRMPYKTSSKESLDHAQLVIDKLGVQTVTQYPLPGWLILLFNSTLKWTIPAKVISWPGCE
jgi:NH3-dependent NAD+ synthetase